MIPYLATNLSDDDAPLSALSSPDPEPEGQSGTVSEGNDL